MFPIGFALPASYFVESVPRTKAFDWMPLGPKRFPARGKYEASIDDEDYFRELYSQSHFAWTHRRGGWDCLRHYEIIAAGAIPFFYDLEECPHNSLGHLPKQLLLEARSMAGVDHILAQADSGHFTEPFVHPADGSSGVNFRRRGTIVDAAFNATRYFEYADRLLQYGKRYLTTAALAAYVLRSLGVEEPRRVLLFARSDGGFDYLETTILSGLSELGINVTVVGAPKEYLFKLRAPDGKLSRQQRDDMLLPIYASGATYGAGFGFACRLKDSIERPFLADRSAEATARLERDIWAKKFDLALFSVKPPYEHLHAVMTSGTPRAFLQYDDMHREFGGKTREACRFGPVFVREMDDEAC